MPILTYEMKKNMARLMVDSTNENFEKLEQEIKLILKKNNLKEEDVKKLFEFALEDELELKYVYRVLSVMAPKELALFLMPENRQRFVGSILISCYKMIADNLQFIFRQSGFSQKVESCRNKKTRVLSIGCGLAPEMMVLNKIHPHVDYIGIDIDPMAIFQAEKCFKGITRKAIPANFKLIQMDALNILQDERTNHLYDFIILRNPFLLDKENSHQQDIFKKILLEIVPKLTKKGVLYLTCFHEDEFCKAIELLNLDFLASDLEKIRKKQGIFIEDDLFYLCQEYKPALKEIAESKETIPDSKLPKHPFFNQEKWKKDLKDNLLKEMLKHPACKHLREAVEKNEYGKALRKASNIKNPLPTQLLLSFREQLKKIDPLFVDFINECSESTPKTALDYANMNPNLEVKKLLTENGALTYKESQESVSMAGLAAPKH
jgi:tRNA G46 methylase TrmB